MKEYSQTEDLFKNPPKQFYSVPFWAWNGKLDIARLKEQIDDAEEMGYSGFIMHPRIGLQTTYLGQEYFSAIRFCQEYAAGKDMQAWLYDEDKWPSGYGAGFVTKNKNYRARYILMTKTAYPEGLCHTTLKTGTRITADGEATLIAKYILVRRAGMLVSYKRIAADSEKENVQDDVWYAYKIILGDQPWFNNQAYVDMLNPEATKCFLNEIYEKYLSAFESEFPANVPAVFTDEPQVFTWQWLKDGSEDGEAGIAYSDAVSKQYFDRFGTNLFDIIPELFWNWYDGKPAENRYNYCKLVAEVFDKSYAGVIEPWCKRNNILFTGHLMDEAFLSGQCRTSFDLMRCYRNYDLPGIDILDNRIEHTTAKQAQSICRQMGKQGVACEMYGVTNWDFDFRGKKFQGDWLAAMGVNYRIPHLMWLYMSGESKRDYPAPLDTHSPWYKRNRVLEDYYARCATILRRGRSVVKIAVLHPIESYWLACGAEKQTINERELLEKTFAGVTEKLLQSNYDFDYLNEQLLEDLSCYCEEECLIIGEMRYNAVILPALLTIRKTTLSLLEEFKRKGGQIFSVCSLPAYVDCKINNTRVEKLKSIVQSVDSLEELPVYLEVLRDIDFIDCNGKRITSFCFQIREDEDGRWVYIAHTTENATAYHDMQVYITGRWEVEIYDAINGKVYPAAYKNDDDNTIVTVSILENDSLILKLISKKIVLEYTYAESVKYYLEEENSLLVDIMEYSLDNGPWEEKEEILRIDDRIRKQLGMSLRTDAFPQPWLTINNNLENIKQHEVRLRSTVLSDICLDKADIVWEGNEDVRIFWNEKEIEYSDGYYIDKMLHKSPLPGIVKGINRLEVVIPFNNSTNLEWFYILGQFGIKEIDNEIHICELQQSVSFGDYSRQGLMFYGGNLIYELDADLPEGRLEVEINDYKAPLIDIGVDNKEFIPVFKAPYKADLGFVSAGLHKIIIRSYGNRINSFGQVHNCYPYPQYFDPASWRTTGERWSYDYRIRSCGVYGPVTVRVYGN